MSNTLRIAGSVILAVLLLLSCLLLMETGLYGLTLFLVLPAMVGAAGVWFADCESTASAAGTGGLSAFAASVCLLLLGWEGAVCIAMVLPITVPLGILGGTIVYELRAGRRPISRSTRAVLLLLPSASLVWDTTARSPVYEVRSSIEIAAPPEVVWKHVVSFSELPEPQEWYFKTGIAYPKRARIDGSGPGAVRFCEFSTGPFVEPIKVWEEPRLLRFTVSENPAPMEEWSPYAKVVPGHLHGYFVSNQGQFRLIPLEGGKTSLEGTTWYRHGLWPATYWRLWSDAIIHRIHLRVLRHIRNLAEAEMDPREFPTPLKDEDAPVR